ncbi:DUF732 domain-containing protein [Microbacterium sp. HMH0099]|uniref:DUF732 domain-containing protein n=1 Tax=Microbacterium sp. HMH0099 TaxID=3414026 RepID=UPI003BF6CAAB
MRRARAVVFALASAAMLSGCGALPVTPAPRTSTPEAVPTAQAPVEDVLAQESAYMAALRAELPSIDRSPASVWLDLGHAVCEAFDSGFTPKQVYDSMSGGSVTQQEASAVVVISGIHLCPEYAPTP